MDEKSEQFLIDISSLHPSLADTYAETIEYWLPDQPPLTTAYGEIGWKIVEDYESIDPAKLDDMFRMIEEGLASGVEPLGTAIATGLIEGMIGLATRKIGVWEKIRGRLGPQSVEHADAWLAPRVTP